MQTLEMGMDGLCDFTILHGVAVEVLLEDFVNCQML